MVAANGRPATYGNKESVMPRSWPGSVRRTIGLVVLAAAWAVDADLLRGGRGCQAEDRDAPAVGAEATAPDSSRPPHTTQALRGRVVWLAEALKRRFGISSDEDAAHDQVALETAEGRLFPIVKDARGRAFMKDPRLLDVEMELVVRSYEGSPVVQVIRIYTIKPDGKYELDYWCDICAIPMYELKDCECCQGPTRIRERRALE
jgi:hypothetical protein